MGNHPRYDVAKDYARGVWYAAPYSHKRWKWAIYTPAGTCYSLHETRHEADQELLELLEWQDMCAEEGIK